MRKVALITGATGDIGRAIAQEFASLGYTVAAVGFKDFEGAEALSDLLKEKQVDFKIYMQDLSSFEGVKEIINDVIREFGRIDALINNAGISLTGLFDETGPEDFDRIFNVNVKSVYNTCRLVLPYMLKEKRGRIINISSIWGVKGAACEALYSASKAAVIGLTKALAMEMAPSGILVNCIAPGAIDTKMNNNLSLQEKQDFANEIPVSRFGAPEEIAGVCAFLAGERSSYITGQVIVCDGGYI